MKKINIFSFVALLFAVLLLVNCGNNQRRGGGSNSPEAVKTIAVHITTPLIKPTVNVYIENSVSMDGYVRGVTEFEQAVYNYLSDIKISGITDTLNLFYINSSPIPYASAADADVIADFIEKLEPITFKQRGGSRGTSDIANVIKSVLKETQSNEIAILVTDGIFSPGTGKDATEYLLNQEIGIKNGMAQYLQKFPNSAVIVYQLFSKFDGQFFNKVDKPIPIIAQRPYYIWIIGQTKNLACLRNAVPENKFNGSGVAKMFSMVSGNQEIEYAIKTNSGNFDKSRINPRTEIEDLTKDNRTGEVRFAVNVDFTNLLLNDDYLTNPQNYELDNYNLTVKRNDSDAKYSHSLIFSSEKVRNGELSVKLKTNKPNWVEEINDDDGSTAIEGKTYGIKYQINGIYSAFTNKSAYYTEIKINIK